MDVVDDFLRHNGRLDVITRAHTHTLAPVKDFWGFASLAYRRHFARPGVARCVAKACWSSVVAQCSKGTLGQKQARHPAALKNGRWSLALPASTIQQGRERAPKISEECSKICQVHLVRPGLSLPAKGMALLPLCCASLLPLRNDIFLLLGRDRPQGLCLDAT